jgi:hypothetical protein
MRSPRICCGALSAHARPPEQEQDVVLQRGEELLSFHGYTYDSERQILLLFGVLLAACGVGLVLLYFWMTILRRAPRAIAVTRSRLRYWRGDEPPAFEELDALLEIGVPPPSLAEAREWLARADAAVASAGEANDASAFACWLAHATASSVATARASAA